MQSLNEIAVELSAEKSLLRKQKLLINASNSLSPGDLTRLYNLLPKLGGKQLCKRAPYFRFMTSRRQQRAMQQPELSAHPATGPTQIYTNSNAAKNTQRLFIIFSGVDKLFFLPLAMLMAILPKGPKTVLVIRGTQDNLYRLGVPPLGKTSFDVAKSIDAKFQPSSYAHVSVLGISAGGFFALRVAEKLNADIGLSFAGILVDNSRFLRQMTQQNILAFDPFCICRKNTTTRLINVVSTKNEYDCFSSIMQRKTRSNLINYHLIYGCDHNVLHRMALTGYVRLFMKIALMPRSLPIRLIAFPFAGIAILFRQLRLLTRQQKIADWYLTSNRH